MTAVAYLLRMSGILWVGASSATIWFTISIASLPIAPARNDAANAAAFDGIVMFAGLNAGMGAYLVFASVNPIKYRYVIDMFLVCQAVCALSAAALKIRVPTYQGHWIGQALSTALGVTLIALLWCPARIWIAAKSYQEQSEQPSVQLIPITPSSNGHPPETVTGLSVPQTCRGRSLP